jgi:hypothetical protein
MYFPNSSNEFKDKVESVHEVFNKILEKLVNAKSAVKKSSMPNTKKNVIIDLASIINTESVLEYPEGGYKIDSSLIKKTQIDSIISKLTSLNDTISNINRTSFDWLKHSIRENFTDYICTDGEYSYDPNDILNDMTFKSDAIKKFKEYIINNHEALALKGEIITCRAEEENLGNPDDIVCLVCNDGDYEDNNLIVYCSSCQMTVHQLCYGILDIPNEDWICYSCLAFGLEKSKYVECILCSVTGGAMKPSFLKKSSAYYNSVYNFRKKNIIKIDIDNKKKNVKVDPKFVDKILRNLYIPKIEKMVVDYEEKNIEMSQKVSMEIKSNDKQGRGKKKNVNVEKSIEGVFL